MIGAREDDDAGSNSGSAYVFRFDGTSWVEEDKLDKRYHFRHYSLPHGGTMNDLMELLALAHQPVLDRTRPLWEYHLVDGLPRNRFAVYCKIHHALVDGVSGIALMSKQLQCEAISITRLRRLHADTHPEELPDKKSSGKVATLLRAVADDIEG